MHVEDSLGKGRLAGGPYPPMGSGMEAPVTDTSFRGGCAARAVITVSMLRGPPLHVGTRRPRDGTTWGVLMKSLALLALAMIALTGLVACGDSADEAVDRARSQANDALDQAGLSDDLDRAQARVDDLVADAEDRTGAELATARRRAQKAVRDARARVEREIDEAKASGESPQEIRDLRRQARERLDDLRERIDEAFRP